MGRKVGRVPVNLDVRGVQPLSDVEIRAILRGADDLIMSGGRSLLARVREDCAPISAKIARCLTSPSR